MSIVVSSAWTDRQQAAASEPSSAHRSGRPAAIAAPCSAVAVPRPRPDLPAVHGSSVSRKRIGLPTPKEVSWNKAVILLSSAEPQGSELENPGKPAECFSVNIYCDNICISCGAGRVTAEESLRLG